MRTPRQSKYENDTRSHIAFSLLELLAAISVIAILGAIVITSVQTVREHSLLAKSLGTIRQYQAANALYSLDHNGRYVPIRTINENGGTDKWMYNQEFREKLGIAEGQPWPDTLISPNAGVVDSNGNRMVSRSYGMNTLEFSDWFNIEISYQPSLASLENPADTIAFADALDWVISNKGNGITRYPGEEIYTQGAVAYRYAGKATVVFYDGHTGAYTMEELLEHEQDWWTLKK